MQIQPNWAAIRAELEAAIREALKTQSDILDRSDRRLRTLTIRQACRSHRPREDADQGNRAAAPVHRRAGALDRQRRAAERGQRRPRQRRALVVGRAGFLAGPRPHAGERRRAEIRSSRRSPAASFSCFFTGGCDCLPASRRSARRRRKPTAAASRRRWKRRC